MTFTTALSLAAMILRMLHEAPQLINAIETFWNTVNGNPKVPAHINAAVQAAFVKMREGEVG